MTLNQFKVFATIAEHMNITKAAYALGSSQPTVSKQLRSLEKHFKLKLFKKNGKGIEITDVGREFLNDIEPVLSQFKKLDSKYLKNTGEHNPGASHLKIAATFGAASEIIPAPLALLKKAQPTVQIVAKANTTAAIERMLLKGELELALCPRLPRSADLVAEDYVTLKVIIFAAARDPINKQNNLKAIDIAALPLILRYDDDAASAEGGTGLFLNTLRDQGYTPNIVMRCESPAALKEAVRQRIGVGVLFYETVKEGIERGTFKQLRVLDLKLEGRIYIMYHRQRPLSSNAQAFLTILRRHREAAVTRIGLAKHTAHMPSATSTPDKVVRGHGPFANIA